MEKLTLTLDCEYNVKDGELDTYLENLNGIDKVIVRYNEEIFAPIFTIAYDRGIITPQIIFLEILSYLNIHKYPILIAFDKHCKKEIVKYEIKSKICCDFCLKDIIEDLFEVDGIVKADSNYEKYINGERDEGNDIITIYYDQRVITKDLMEKIIKELNI